MTAKDAKNYDDRLGDLLFREKIISLSQLDQAVQCQVLFGGRLGTNLLELGFVTEKKLLALLEKKHGLPAVSRQELQTIPRDIIRLIPRELAVEHWLVPVRKAGKGLETAMLDPWRESTLQVLNELTSLAVKPLIALELDIMWALEKYYGLKREARFINLDRWLDHQRQAAPPGEKKKKPPAFKSEPLFPDPQSITQMEGAPNTLDEFWDRVGRTSRPEYHLPRVLEQIERASSRDQIATIILDFANMFFARVLLFVVNEGLLVGWDGRGEGLDSRLALSIMIPLSRRSIFKTVMDARAYFLGPIPETPINRRFLAGMGPARPGSALLVPVLVSGKVAALLYADMGHDQPAAGQIAPIQTALAATGKAFQRLIMAQKALNPKPKQA